ncbi:MAG: DUF4349 domain-containing protein [Clostridiales Family XIII bacterium]|jgi:hypothetical protein|nr:DUF4349 domain-containing protein [Clostridiales Family XIII bacterium]
MRKSKRVLAAVLAVVLIISAAALTAACSGKSESSISDEALSTADAGDASSSYSEAAMAESGAGSAAMDTAATGGDAGSAAVAEGRKLIRRVSIQTETKALDTFMERAEADVKSAGGYFENRTESDDYNGSGIRSASFTVRVPVTRADGFIDSIKENSNVTHSSETTEDVTLIYTDTENLKKMYELEQQNLLKMLEDATKISDMMDIEQRLAEVRYNLEAQTSQLRTYDNLVDYATIDVNVREVEYLTTPKKESAGTRISKGFSGSLGSLAGGLQNFGVGFIIALPYLLFAALLAIIVYIVVRRVIKRAVKRRAEKNIGER